MRHGPRRQTRARHEQAARLRACGRTWQEIADHLGYRSRKGAQIAVARLYAQMRDSPDLSRRSLVEGLRIVNQVLYEQLAGAKARNDTAGVVACSRELRSCSEQMARLDGLHAAAQVDVTVRPALGEWFRALAGGVPMVSRPALLPVMDAEVVAGEDRGAGGGRSGSAWGCDAGGEGSAAPGGAERDSTDG